MPTPGGEIKQMKQLAPLQPFLLFVTLIYCAATVACGRSGQSLAHTNNPLVAQYSMPTDCAGQAMVEFGPDTTYGRTTAWYSTPASSEVSIQVAGMRASTTYHMRSQFKCDTGATETGSDLTFTTGPLPAIGFPTMTVTRPNPSSATPENPGIELVDVTVANNPALFTDRDANPIWYYDVGQGNYPYTFKLLPNGHIILNIVQSDLGSVLREVDLAGNTIRQMYAGDLSAKMQTAGYDFTPSLFHHDLLPLANGHLIVLTNFTKNFTDLPGYPGTTAVIGDGIVDLDENWNPVWVWNSFDYLDVNRHLNGLPDWTHSNALVYSGVDGNLVLSMRHQSWVLKLDYSNGAGSGNIIWKLGYQGDFTLAQGTDPSLWFSFQHFPSIISQAGSQTTLAIWDNGDFRVLDGSGTTCGSAPAYAPCYSRATVFQIDESTMVGDLLWNNLPGDFGLWGGSINQLGNGNVEFDINAPTPPPTPTLASEVQEVTQSSTPQIVWQLDFTPVTATAYRAYRVPSLYPDVSWAY
jgi:arylsulfate sulfotransferase